MNLDKGNIRATGVGLREGEIAAVDALGISIGDAMDSEPIARNALIRVAVRRLLMSVYNKELTIGDLCGYFSKPQKPSLKLRF